MRPATVCGYSKRQRLDVVVNILTNLAYHNRKITIFGGPQLRPNININDMTNAYINLINQNPELISGEIYNVGFENYCKQAYFKRQILKLRLKYKNIDNILTTYQKKNSNDQGLKLILQCYNRFN